MDEIIKGLEEFFVKGKGEGRNLLNAIDLLYNIKEKKCKFYKYLESLENETKNNSKESKEDFRILINGTTNYDYNDCYVTEETYNSLKIGDWFVYDEDYCFPEEPYTQEKERK